MNANEGAADSGSSSMAGVLVSVVVVALSLAFLPMSAVTVIMAGMAGIWWLSSSTADKAVQMSSLPASAAANGSAQPGAGVPGAGAQVGRVGVSGA